MLATAVRGAAVLDGRDYVLPDDVKRLATPVLAHRMVLAPAAEIEETTPESVLAEILARVPAPR